MAVGSLMAGISGAIDLYRLLGPFKAYIVFAFVLVYAVFMIIVVRKDSRDFNS